MNVVTYARVEIPKKIKLAVFERAGGLDGVRCEGACGLLLRGKKFEYHHVKGEHWQTTPPSARDPIVASDVQLLCVPCHAAISAKDTKHRAHSKRLVEKVAGISRSKSKPAPRYRKKMSGDIVDMVTGEIVRKGRRP